MILEPIFEAEFDDLSFGFRPNRSTIDALATILHRASNKGLYHWVIEGDIKSCFDKIHHRKLIQLLRSRIRDEKLLRLVWRFLRAGVMESGAVCSHPGGYTSGRGRFPAPGQRVFT